jgi:hypothetical protein
MSTTSPRLTKAIERQHQALADLAATLVAHGAPSDDPFRKYGVSARTNPRSLAPAAVADHAIDLVHAIFRVYPLPSDVTKATKRAGNAARALRRVIALEPRTEQPEEIAPKLAA